MKLKNSVLKFGFPAILLLPFFLAACNAGYDSSRRMEVSLPLPSTNPTDGDPTKAGGGVDVGNLTTYLVPTTQVALNAGQEWVSSKDPQKLSLTADDQSSITGQVQQLAQLVSPNIKSLELHLAETHPGQKITHRSMNGSPALELVTQDNEDGLKADIYLINEGKNIVVIKADLKKNSLASGKEVLESTRILYQGEAIPAQLPKTVVIEGRNYDSKGARYAYALAGDCFPWAESNCSHVAMGFSAYSNKLLLQIGLGGYDTGRIVELGPQSEIPFESIRVDGPHLVAKGKNVPLADIYTLFTPKNLSQEFSTISPQEGHVYLIRTISWPDEDIVTKVRIDKLSQENLTMTYERLTEIPKEILQARVDEANAYTRKVEMPKDRGEVVLYNRSVYNSYAYANFNFQYSTSGNHWITFNSWQLGFSTGCNGKPVLAGMRSASGVSRIHRLATPKDLGSIIPMDFPDANIVPKENCGLNAEIGAVYLIETYDSDDGGNHIRGAVKVLDMEKDGKWIRLEFRRILVESAKDWVHWQNMNLVSEALQIDLELNGDPAKSRYSPFTRTRNDQKAYYWDSIDTKNREEDGIWLRVDSRPYPKERGFRLVDPKLFDKMTYDEARTSMSKIPVENSLPAETGQVFLVDLKNYYSHMTLLIRIDDVKIGKLLRISVRELHKAKAPFHPNLP